VTRRELLPVEGAVNPDPLVLGRCFGWLPINATSRFPILMTDACGRLVLFRVIK
jgi:hypothetical protein